MCANVYMFHMGWSHDAEEVLDVNSIVNAKRKQSAQYMVQSPRSQEAGQRQTQPQVCKATVEGLDSQLCLAFSGISRHSRVATGNIGGTATIGEDIGCSRSAKWHTMGGDDVETEVMDTM